MMEENMYPIKYAVLQLKEKGGWINGYNDIIRGNIASKCYVMESSIKYLPNGDTKIYHKVVFPFSCLETLKLSLRHQSEYIGKKVTPSYDANGKPYPVTIVSNLFDSYEEAKEHAEEENEKLKKEIVLKIPVGLSNSEFKETLADYEKNFDTQLSYCQLFEKNVLLNTEDMEVTLQMDEINGLYLRK